MLEKDYQLRAYQNLVSAGGMKTPEAVTTSEACNVAAKSLADRLTELVLPAVPYPGTITGYITAISDSANTLTAASKLGNNHAGLLKANADLSVLLQLNIGWDIYCRANGMEISELPISVAIGDEQAAKDLLNALSNIDIAAVAKAMTEINQVLNVGTGGSASDGTAQPIPSITQEQIKALKEATDALIASVSALAPYRDVLKTLFDEASLSASVSMQAYTDAVGTALAEASLGNVSTSSAVSALVPGSVLDELKHGFAGG